MREPTGDDKLYTLVYHEPSSLSKFKVPFALRSCGTIKAGYARTCAKEIMTGVTSAVNRTFKKKRSKDRNHRHHHCKE